MNDDDEEEAGGSEGAGGFQCVHEAHLGFAAHASQQEAGVGAAAVPKCADGFA